MLSWRGGLVSTVPRVSRHRSPKTHKVVGMERHRLRFEWSRDKTEGEDGEDKRLSFSPCHHFVVQTLVKTKTTEKEDSTDGMYFRPVSLRRTLRLQPVWESVSSMTSVSVRNPPRRYGPVGLFSVLRFNLNLKSMCYLTNTVLSCLLSTLYTCGF